MSERVVLWRRRNMRNGEPGPWNVDPDETAIAGDSFEVRTAVLLPERIEWRWPGGEWRSDDPPTSVIGPDAEYEIETRTALLDPDQEQPEQRRVCPECGEPDEGNDAHDDECSQIFPYLSLSEMDTYEKLRPCFVEWIRDPAALSTPPEEPRPEQEGVRCTCPGDALREPPYAPYDPDCPVHNPQERSEKVRARIRRWRLIFKWTIRKRHWLSPGERFVASLDPILWSGPEEFRRAKLPERALTRDEEQAVHRYLAEKYDIEEPPENG